MLFDHIHLKREAQKIVAASCLQWLDRDDEVFEDKDIEDDLPGLSNVLEDRAQDCDNIHQPCR